MSFQSLKTSTLRQSIFGAFIIHQDARRIPFRVPVLARPDCPDEGGKTKATEDQRYGDQEGENIHRADLTRRAFNSTVMEEVDIAKAASSGVA